MKKFKIFFIMFFATLMVFGIKLDIKTHLGQKLDMAAIKYGVIYELKALGHRIVEFGEHYAVWLENDYKEEIAENIYKIQLSVKITRPTLSFDNKRTLIKKKVVVEYEHRADFIDVNKTHFWKFIKKKYKSLDRESSVKAYVVGREVANAVDDMLNRLLRTNKRERL